MKIYQSRRHTFENKKFNSTTELRAYMILRKILGQGAIILVNKKIPGGSNRELDIFLPLFNVGIEIQGPLHCLNFCIIYRDVQKFLLCKKLGIKIFYIPCDKITKKYFTNIKNDFNRNPAKADE